MAPCRQCAKRNAVAGAAASWLLWPLHRLGFTRDADALCLACANEFKGFGIVVWALLVAASLWLVDAVMTVLHAR